MKCTIEFIEFGFHVVEKNEEIIFIKLPSFMKKREKSFTNERNIQTAKVHLRTNLLQGHISLLPIK